MGIIKLAYANNNDVKGRVDMVFEREKTKEGTKIGKIVAVMSGKGGVGKSIVASLTAVALRDRGNRVGILDADITGPSIPKIFGINSKRAMTDSEGIYPVSTATGIQVVSLNLLIDQEEAPVIWRGPMIANTVKQLYTDVNWGELDYLLIDLPPGTGDVPLTIMQSLPVDDIIIVSSPQDLVQLIVKKSVNMARMLGTQVLGLVENMSYLKCPHCGEIINVFGESGIDRFASDMNLDLLAKLPIDPEFAKLCDEGKIELYIKLGYEQKEAAVKIIERIGGKEK